jgi:hypothetical protein
LNGGKARAGAANPKRNDAAFNAVKRETSACTNDAGAASQAWIKDAINEVFKLLVAIEMFFVYSRHVSYLSRSVS